MDRTGSTRFCLIPLSGEKLPYERVAFLAGQYMADQSHEARAKEQEDDATELTVAT